MRTSINTLKFEALLCLVFLFLTYSISLNEENKWLVLNTPWLSNNFAFVIAGGTLASIFVMLACEIHNYYLMKRQSEDYLFCQLFALYTQITIIHYNTKCQLNEPNVPVPTNLIEEIVNRGLLCLNSLNTIDFVTFKTQNAIREVVIQFNGKNGMYIRSFLQNTIFLKIAINEDKITMLKNGKNELINSSSQKTHLALKKIHKDSSVILTFIEESLEIIDTECGNRYHWNDIKRSVITSEENYASVELSKFLELPAINFHE